MTTTEREHDTLGDFLGDVVDAALGLAERATVSAVDLAAQAVKDAGHVASRFEILADAAAREGAEIAADTLAAMRDAVERAEERVTPPASEAE